MRGKGYLSWGTREREGGKRGGAALRQEQERCFNFYRRCWKRKGEEEENLEPRIIDGEGQSNSWEIGGRRAYLSAAPDRPEGGIPFSSYLSRQPGEEKKRAS